MWFYALFKNWKLIVILLMFATLGFGGWKYERLKKENYELKLQVQEKVIYLEDLEDAVSLQNDMIEEAAKRTKELEKAKAEAQKRIDKIREEERKKIIDILEAKSGSSCEENMDWLVDFAKGNKK